MKYIFGLFITTGFVLFGVSPVPGGICQGDFLCYLLFSTIAYLPLFLILTAITLIGLAVFLPAIPFGNKLKYSILLSFILILFYHNFLSIWIEKREVVNSYKQSLNQVDYELYEPTYIPDGHKLFESSVYKGNLYFFYSGNEAGQFVISEFKKPQKIDLSPPDCRIGGFVGQNDNFKIVDSSSVLSAVYGNCQEIKTPQGISVYLMTFKTYSEKQLAAIILGNTLVTISGYNFSNQELMGLVDGLEKKNPSDINFKIINRTIGR